MMINVIGYLAGLLAVTSFIPQVMKTFRTKQADDLSIPMLLLTLTANFLYVIYGILLELYPIVIMIGIMSCIIVFQIILTVKYSNREEKTPNEENSLSIND